MSKSQKEPLLTMHNRFVMFPLTERAYGICIKTNGLFLARGRNRFTRFNTLENKIKR